MNRPYCSFSAGLFVIAVVMTATAVAEWPTSAGAASAEPRRLHRWTNLDWAHWDYPLFSLFGPFDHKPDAAAVAKAIRGKTALDVYNFREVVLAEDEKGLTIGLHEQDSRLLKALARKYDRGWFVAVAPPKDFFAGEAFISVVPITSSMADGQVIFKHPECASVARGLRWRFRIAEFRLTPW